jgi:hypothetical protein
LLLVLTYFYPSAIANANAFGSVAAVFAAAKAALA